MAARANYVIEQGTNFSSTVTVKDSQGVPLNLTDYTATARMALGHSSTRTRTDLTIEFASDRSTGNVSMSLTAAQTALCPHETNPRNLPLKIAQTEYQARACLAGFSSASGSMTINHSLPHLYSGTFLSRNNNKTRSIRTK